MNRGASWDTIRSSSALSPKNEATELGYVQTPCSTRGSGMSMRAYAQL